MTQESLLAQVSLANNATLKAVYEHCCEEYRRRLCEQWDLDIKDSWWVGDHIGSVLILQDMEFSMNMDDVRFFVDYSISYDDFIKYWDAIMFNEHYINPRAWFINGARPKDY